MAGIYGGTIVLPRDGDELSSDGEDGLIAQVIPLRQRTHEPAPYGPETLDDQFPPSKDAPLPERSVWEPPTTELRRRHTQPGSPTALASLAHGAGRLASRLSWRFMAIVAVSVAVVVVLTVALDGALEGQHQSAARHARSSSPRINATVTSGRRPAKHSTARAHTTGDQPRGLQAGRHKQPPGSVGRVDASETAVANSTAGATAETQPVARTPAAQSLGNEPSENASAHTQGAPAAQVGTSAHVSTPSTAQSQCVPGELGC